MLWPVDLPRLRWHPAMRRVENHALFVERRGGQPVIHPNVDPDGKRVRSLSERALLHELAPGERRDHAIIYLMACGHRSLPNHAVCEQGCLRAPAYAEGFRGTATKPRGVS